VKQKSAKRVWSDLSYFSFLDGENRLQETIYNENEASIMKITKEELTQIIKEELEAVLDEKRKKKKKKKKKKGKKDACYHKVRSRYDVWPSAYASGALVKCRKVGAKNWGNKTNEEFIPGGESSKYGQVSVDDMIEGIAEEHGVSVEQIRSQFEMGVEEEMEHAEEELIAQEIALDHLVEDPEYYSKLDAANLEEVYSDKQRRYMCAMAKDGAKRPKGLSQAEAKEMCEGPMLDEKKRKLRSKKIRIARFAGKN
jgi:hypothetical protein